MDEYMGSENSLRRIPPHDSNAERCIIGSMLMDPDAISDVSGILTKEDFYSGEYGILFEAISELHREGKAVDAIVLGEKLRSMGAPEHLYQLSYIGDILAGQETSVFAADYARIVRDKSLLRQMIRLTDTVSKDCYEAQGSVGQLMDRVEEDVFRLVQSKNGSGEFTPMSKIVSSVIDEIEEASRSSGKITGVPTGFYDLDNHLTGLHKGELILVAARPSMGKTALVLNFARHVITREDIPTVIFSLEMSKESLVSRMVAMEAKVDAKSIRTGKLADREWDAIIEATEVLSRAPLYIDDNSSITLSELRSKCRKLKQTKNIGLIIIDYLQLMNASRPVESRQLFIAEVSRALKGLAKELGVPVIALSQLNRAADSRTDHKPVLADLRESGSIEQDADVVMFIYRDEYYNPDTTKRPGEADIIVAKNRSGALGTVSLLWDGKYTLFKNKAREKKDA